MTTTELAPDIDYTPDATASNTAIPDGDAVAFEPVLPTSAEEVKDFTLLYVDPDEVVIGPNARAFTADDLDPDFVADLGDVGNYVPIIARFDEYGQLVVRDGQVRTYGLREAKRLAVEGGNSWHKALILAQDFSITDERAAEIERLVEQHGANFLRLAMTQADHLRTVQELLELGVEPEKVGKRLRLKDKDATVLVTVAQSTRAADLAQQGVLEMSESVIVAEFEAFGDEKDAVETLIEIAQSNPRNLPYTAQRLRDARSERLALQAAAAELVEQGVMVIKRPEVFTGSRIRQLAELRPTARTRPGTALSVKRHSKCAGHAAYLIYDGPTYYNKVGKVRVIHVCTDFRTYKHAYRNAEPGKTLVERSISTTGAVAKGPTAAEKTRYRRMVIANGKAWDSATFKRMQALELFAKRRSLPQIKDTWLEAMRASSGRYADAASKGHRLALKLLGWDSKFNNKTALRAEILKAKPERARVISMVMVLAAIEQGVSRRTTWESPTDEEIAYFAELATLDLKTQEPTGLKDWVPSAVETLVLAGVEPADPALVAAVDEEVDVEASPDDETDNDTDEELPADEDASEVPVTPVTPIDVGVVSADHEHQVDLAA